MIMTENTTVQNDQTTTMCCTSRTNEEWIQKGNGLYQDDKLLEAAICFRKVPKSSLNKKQLKILEQALDIDAFLKDMKSSIDDSKTVQLCDLENSTSDNENSLKSNLSNKNESESSIESWVKQSIISLNNRHSHLYYKLNKNTGLFTLKVETPIEKSLLIPLIAVLNESELYASWMPQWKVPRLRIRRSEKLQQTGRASQVIIVTFDVPWPLAAREAVISAVAVDDIDGEYGDIIVRLQSLETGDEDGLVPPTDDNVYRMKFHGGFTFRKNKNNSDTGEQYEDEETIISSFLAHVDSKFLSFPKPLLDFVLRQAFGLAWNRLLRVAEEVRDGKRKEHDKLISAKREILYDWVEKRVSQMLKM